MTAYRPRRRIHAGFTLIELITVMILVGILSFVAIPRLGDTTFKERGFRDGVLSTVQHARHVAIASRRFVCVTVAGGTGGAATVSLSRDLGTAPESAAAVNCTAPVALPTPGSGCGGNNQVCAPAGITLGGTPTIIFDPLGRSITAPNVAGAASITISNQTPVTVSAETGYIQ